jgi:hypothetical protein
LRKASGITQCFRIRLILTGSNRVNSQEKTVILAESSVGGQNVVLRGHGENSINDSDQLVVEGYEYRNEDEARNAGERWRHILEKAFAAVNLGADFGDRAAKSVLTDAGQKMFSEQVGQPVLNDVHGVMTFECEPRPRFISGGVKVSVGRPLEHLLNAIERARAANARMADEERLAYDLYSASMSMPGPDARFVMLMMAIETLTQPAPRSHAARDHVERLIDLTNEADLPEGERDSLIGNLRWLLDESISRAGRRLAGRLVGRTYDDQTPENFFARSYDLRSRLVHGHHPRPDFGEVNARCAPLEMFVSDLLAGELKTNDR